MPEVAPAPRFAVVFNPSKSGEAALRHAVRLAEAQASAQPTFWFATAADDGGRAAARAALDAGVDGVIAAGGDGTVRAVASVVCETSVPLGIVPIGTGNLFARNLGISVTSLETAAITAFTGAPHPVDITRVRALRPGGREDDDLSLVVAGVGIDATLIANTNPELKRRVGWLAYVDAGLRLWRTDPHRVWLRVEQGRMSRARVAGTLVANVGTLPGGAALVPDASVDDGAFDVVLLQPRSPFGWLLIWRTVTWEHRVLRRTAVGRQYIAATTGRRPPRISFQRGRSLYLAVEGQPQPFEIDGDVCGEIVSAQFRIDPGALLVRVPNERPTH
ncbi:MAG TPA: diacylglycerol kinase family protein [Candidatus Lumbricidophila sp.]|nr:diacylglycerol kinase family protein [Candidatus Lumbricidophila sp.]